MSGASVFEKVGSKNLEPLAFQLAQSMWIVGVLAVVTFGAAWVNAPVSPSILKSALMSPVVIAYLLFALRGSFLYLWLLKRKEPVTILLTLAVRVFFLGETKAWKGRQWIGVFFVLIGMPMVLI